MSTAEDNGEMILRALDAAQDAVVVVTDGRVAYANARFCDMWDLPAAFVRGAGMDDLLPAIGEQLADSGEFDLASFLLVDGATGGPDASAEFKLRDGRRIAVRVDVAGGSDRASGLSAWFREMPADRTDTTSALLAASSVLLAGSLEYETLARSLARIAVPALGDWCAVDIVADDGDIHRIGVAHVDRRREDSLLELDRRFPYEPGVGRIRGRVVATGETVAFDEIDDEALDQIARDDLHRRLLLEVGFRSAVWLPLSTGGRTLGVMSFGGGGDHRYGPEVLELGRELAKRGALALDNARTYRRLRDREAQQAVVAALGQAALTTTDLQSLFDVAVDRLATTLGCEYTKVLELQPDGRQLRLVAGVGWQPGLVGAATVGAEIDSQAGYTLLTDGPIIVEDLATESRFRGPALLRDHGVVSGMSAIIEGLEGHWGVLGVHTTRRRRFSTDDLHFLQAVANVLSGAIARRRGEEALRERDDRLELTLAASRTGIWEWQIDSGALIWSDQIAAMHGLPAGAVPGGFEEYLELVYPDDRERFQAAVEHAIRNLTDYDFEYRVVWPDGTVRWTNGAARVFVDAEGRAVKMVGTGRDVTDRKRAEEERDALLEAERQANVLRDAFIGVVSHELRTPITTIYGGLKLLTREHSSLDADARAGVLADVEAEADHLRRLVEDLLVLTRAERGPIDIAEEPVQILHLAHRVVASEAARWPLIRFEIEPARGIPVASGDETSIEQVLRNLLTNGAKYSPPDSTVRLVAEADATEIRARILDDGFGISGSEADRLFQLFYRSPTTAGQVSGAGIGLFVARRLVEAMGGRMWANPRPEGGSEFGFALPLYDVDAEETPASS